jgi:hypothetical protein
VSDPVSLGIVGTGSITLLGLLPHLAIDDVRDRRNRAMSAVLNTPQRTLVVIVYPLCRGGPIGGLSHGDPEEPPAQLEVVLAAAAQPGVVRPASASRAAAVLDQQGGAHRGVGEVAEQRPGVECAGTLTIDSVKA